VLLASLAMWFLLVSAPSLLSALLSEATSRVQGNLAPETKKACFCRLFPVR